MKRKLYFFLLVFFIVTVSAQSQSSCTVYPRANTILITNDTTIMASFGNHYLVCSGVTLNYTDNSGFEHIYLESGATLNLSGYGYSRVYAKTSATFNSDSVQYDSLTYEPGAILIDTISGAGFRNHLECSGLVYDYSNLPGGVGCSSFLSNETLSNLPVKIYPNPVMDLLFIESEASIKRVSIFDISGKLVNIHYNLQSIPVASLSPGNYFMDVEFEDPALHYPQKVHFIRK